MSETSLAERLKAKWNDMGWRYAACNHTRHYLFRRCRYPAFTPDYLERQVRLPDTSAAELQAYLENSSRRDHHKALVIVVFYLTYCFKNLLAPYKMLTMLNYNKLEDNLRPIAGSPGSGGSSPGPVVRQFSCLATNCSRLSPLAGGQLDDEPQKGPDLSRLARDLAKLPLFRLCHPRLTSWYSPVTGLDSLGVLILFCIAFNSFLLGSWCTIQQLVSPAGNEMIMFIVAPGVTARMAWRRTSQLFASVASSYANFRHNSSLRFSTQTEHEYLASASRRRLVVPAGRAEPCSARRAEGKLEGAAATLRPLDSIRPERELDKMTRESLAIIRTSWWRRIITNLFLSVFALTVAEVLILTRLTIAYIHARHHEKILQLKMFAEEMHAQNCHLWYAQATDKRNPNDGGDGTKASQPTGPDGAGGQLIELASFQMDWTAYSRFEMIIFNVMPVFGVSMMFSYYWGVIAELEVWLAELRTLLVATLVVARLKLAQFGAARSRGAGGLTTSGRVTAGGSPPSTDALAAPHRLHAATALASVETKHFYNMRYLRQQFQQETQTFAMTYMSRLRNCKFRPEDGAIVYAREPALHDINARINFKVREIRFTDLVRRGPHALPATTSPVDVALAMDASERLAGEAVGGGDEDEEEGPPDELASDMRTMEEIYVNFRLFIEHVHGLSPSMGVILAMTYLLNFGVVCIAFMCSRKFSDLKTELTFMIIAGWFVSNILILLAANFHASAKKIQQVMWSIIAQLTTSRDSRIRHMRFLWVKQVQDLDAQGGLALDAFGLRVTYVNIIQIIIWTVTIIVMALKS